MGATNRPESTWRRRRHGVRLEPADRRALERSGWRTTLEYRENHVRGRDGTLLEVIPAWTAEAERYDGGFTFASAVGRTIEEAWATVREDIEADRARSTTRIRLLRV